MQDEQATGPRPASGADSPAAAAQQRPAADPPSADLRAAQRPPAGPPAAELRAPATGEARVDEALTRLNELPGLPVTEHPAVFEQVHRRLREVLGELDAGPDGGAGPTARPGR